MLTGALPLALGLSWQLALLTIVIGSVAGGLAVAGMAPPSIEAGSNATVASVAAFGIRGRYLGSLIIQVIDLGYFALALVLAIPAIDEAIHRLTGLGGGRLAAPVTMIVTASLTVAIGIYGHRTVIAAQKFNSVAGLLSFGVLAISAAVRLALHPLPHPPAAAHGLAAAFVVSTTVQIANAISYAPYVGDSARYIPPCQARPAVIAAWTGMQAGAVSILAGLLIGLAVPDPSDAVRQMVDLLPVPLILPVVAAGVAANVSSGSILLYNGMLDLHAVLWRWTRLQAGALFAAVGVTLAVAAVLLLDLVGTIEVLATVVGILAAPWIAVVITAFLCRPEPLDPGALQDFALLRPENRYARLSGFEWRSLVAWALGAGAGLAVHATAPLDLSIPVAIVVATAAWLATHNRSRR